MTLNFGRIGVWSIILVFVALFLLALLGPMIHAAHEAIQIAQVEAMSKHAELAEYLRAELRNTRIADPYDARWWNKRLTSKQYNSLEQALDSFLNDTELDGQADVALYQALESVGIHVTNLQDAVHAANHLVNNTPKPKESEPNPKQIEEDYSGSE